MATKSCPMCGEEILAVAIKCKHCQSIVDQTSLVGSSSSERRPPAVQHKVRSFWRTTGLFMLASAPGFAVFGIFAFGALVRSMGGDLSDHMGDGTLRMVALGSLGWGGLGMPAAFAFAGALHLARSKRLPDLAFVVPLTALFTWLFYVVFMSFTEALIDDYAFLRHGRPFVVAASLAAVGGALVGWWGGLVSNPDAQAGR